MLSYYQTIQINISFLREVGAKIYVETLKVVFLALQTWAFFAKLQILLNISKSQDQANNQLFYETAQKPTSNFTTKMFDP